MNDIELEQALSSLRQEYAQALPMRMGEIERLWHQLAEDGWSREGFMTFIRMAHQLAGSGATYGFARVTERARALEQYAKSLNPAALPTPAECAEIDRRLASLNHCWE